MLDFDRFLAGMPVARAAGHRLVRAERGEAELALTPRDDSVQIEGRVHGGVLATLADTAAVYAIYRDLEPGRAITSIEFKLNFLRPVLLGAGDVHARARVVQQGKRIALCDVELSQGEKLAAKGLFTYLFVEQTPATSGTAG